MCKAKILSTGCYVPEKAVSSKELDAILQKPANWVFENSGIKTRYYAKNTDDFENTSYMGAKAALMALNNSQMALKDIDCIIAASGIGQQAIPCTASLIKNYLDDQNLNIPTFDINATCLSFITAMDLAACAIETGRYKNVLIVASDISSVGLDSKHNPNLSIMFGDGAAAAILSKATDSSKIIASDMITINSGNHLCVLKAGGSLRGKFSTIPAAANDYLFEMQGPELYKQVARNIPKFLNNLLAKANLSIDDINLVIPHQASMFGLSHFRKVMKIPSEKMISILEDYGNQIAASIPTALHHAIQQQKINRGDKILIVGTSAGLSIGAIVIEY